MTAVRAGWKRPDKDSKGGRFDEGCSRSSTRRVARVVPLCIQYGLQGIDGEGGGCRSRVSNIVVWEQPERRDIQKRRWMRDCDDVSEVVAAAGGGGGDGQRSQIRSMVKYK